MKPIYLMWFKRTYLPLTIIIFIATAQTSFSQDSTRVFYAWPYKKLGQEEIFYRYRGDSLKLENGNFKVMSSIDIMECLFSGSFKNNKKAGTWKYYDHGKLSHTCEYVNDKIEGKTQTFDENNTLIAEITYKDGVMNGPFFWEDFIYKLGTTYGQFENGIPSGIWKYIDNGILRLEIDYTRGFGNHIMSYYSDGKLSSKEIYHNKELIKTEKF